MADSCANALAFAELEALARFWPSRLLALDRSRIAREQTEIAKLATVCFIERDQRTRNRESQRTGLPSLTTTRDIRAYIEPTERIRCGERLLNRRDERGARE